MHASRQKSYGQFCPVARTLDLLGDRWTLLIVRDLLRGERRFTDLAQGLVGIPRNLLVDRLRTLEAAGLVTRQSYREIPPRVEYELTDRGRSLEPVLEAISRWGYFNLPRAEAGCAMDLDQALERMTRVYRGGAGPSTIELRLTDAGGATRFLNLAPDQALISSTPLQRPSATVVTDFHTWLGLVSGHIDVGLAPWVQKLEITGDSTLVARLPDLFICPVGL